MECACPLAFLGFCLLFVIAVRRKKSSTPEPRPDQQADEYVEQILFDDEENYYRVRRGKKRTYVLQHKAGSWKIIVRETLLMGTKHRKAAAKRFLSGAVPWLDLEREPTNKFDPNAIRVMSTWRLPDGKVQREHLGYVAKDVAALIASDLPPNIPITATIDSMAASNKYGASVFFTIHVASGWCPLCYGDLGRSPKQPGTCNSCGGSFDLSPHFRVPISAS